VRLRLAAIGLMVAGAALAAPPLGIDPNSPTANWVRTLKQPNGGSSCCSIADCRPAEAVFGEDNHWHVILGGKSETVPDDKILEDETFNGDAWVCSVAGTILCFVKPGAKG